MLIEFVGPPGAGKTSLCRALVRTGRFIHLREAAYAGLRREARRRNSASYSLLPSYRLARILKIDKLLRAHLRDPVFRRACVEHGSLVARLWETVVNFEAPVTTRFLLLQTFAERICDDYLLRRSDIARPVLADEYFCHRIFVLFALRSWTYKQENIYDYADIIPLPDVLVSVEASPETCVNRKKRLYSGRTVPPRLPEDDLSEEERIGAFERLSCVTRIFCAYIEGKGTRIVTVRNDGQPLRDALAKLETALAANGRE